MSNQITDGPAGEIDTGGRIEPLSLGRMRADRDEWKTRAESEAKQGEKWEADYKFANQLWVSVRKERDKLAKNNARLRKAFDRYGRHDAYCPDSPMRGCTCGLDATLADLAATDSPVCIARDALARADTVGKATP